MNDLSVELGSFSNPSTAAFAAAYTLTVLTLRLSPKSLMGTVNEWAPGGKVKAAATSKLD